MRKLLVSLAAAATLAVPAAATPTDSLAQQSTRQDGLVNVAAGDLVDVENINIGAVVGVLAEVCATVPANVAALASQVDQSGTTATTTCSTGSGSTVPITITQNNPGRGR